MSRLQPGPTGHSAELGWQSVTLEDVAGFVAWLRLPPEARDGRVAVLPTVEYHCSAASVNRKLAALTSFCEFHARHGVDLSGLLVRMQPAGHRRSATSYRPFLHHVTKNKPERQRAIKLKTSPARPRVLTVKRVQAVLDACDHLRDRLLFAVLLDTGVRIGEALGLRHEDMGIAEREVIVVFVNIWAEPRGRPWAYPVRTRLKSLQYHPAFLDAFIAETGLALQP